MNERHTQILTEMLTGDESVSRKIVAGPCFIRECNEKFLDQISRITGSVPGPWPAPPNYDGRGNDLTLINDGEIDEPFSTWANQFNQSELRRLCNSIDFAEFILVDCALPEHVIRTVFDEETRKCDARIVEKGLAAIEQLSWFAVAIDPDAIRMLFICAPSRNGWVDALSNALGEPDEHGR